MGSTGDIEVQPTNRRRSKAPLILHVRADVPSRIPPWERDLVAARILAAVRFDASVSEDSDAAIGGAP